MVVIGDEEADNPAVDEHDGSEQPTIDWTTFELDASYLPSDLSDDERKHSLKRLNASIRELQECAARLREAQDVYARACEVSKRVREQHARDTTVMRRELQHRLELMAASISSDPSADTSKQPHHRKDTGTRIQELQRLVNEMRFVLLHRLVEARQEPTLSEAQLVRDHQTRFNQINQSLREMASELGARLPWQLSYRLLQAQGHIPFEAGYITDAQGERINEAVCHLCALVLQAWSIGHGTPRYICLDSGRVYCVPCFRAASSIWAAIDSSSSPSSSLAASERLDSIEPHRSIASWMLEHDIPTFLRFPIGRADTLQTLLRCAFRQYAHRPAIAVPIVDHSAVTLVRRVQPESTASIAACSTDGVVWLTYHALERLVSPLAGWLRDTLSHEGSFKSILMLGDGPTLWSLVVELAACQARVPLLHHSEQVLQQQGPLAALCSEHNVGLLVIRPSVLPQLLQHEFADDFRVALLLECLTHDEPIATASVAQFTFEHVLAAPESMELDNSNSSSSSNSNSLPPLNIYHTSFLEDGTVRFTSQNEYKWLRSLNQPNFELPLTYCFSDPLSNRSSRFGLWRTLCNGGRIAVTPIDVNVLQQLEARADTQALCEARLRLQMRRFDALYVALPSYCSPVSVHIPCGSFDEHKGSWYQAFQLKLVDPALSAAELMTQAVFPFARPCKLGTSKVIGDIVEPPDHEYHLNVDALNCWTFQNHMDCAAAAIAGAINTLYKRTRNNSLLCPNDISSLMKFMAEQQLLQSVAEFEASLRDFAAPLSLDDAHLAIEQLHRAINERLVSEQGRQDEDTVFNPMSIVRLRELVSASITHEGLKHALLSQTALFSSLQRLKRLREAEIQTSDQDLCSVFAQTGLDVECKPLEWHLASWSNVKRLVSEPETLLLICIPYHLVIVFGYGEDRHSGTYRHLLIGRPSGGQAPSGWVPWSAEDAYDAEGMWPDNLDLDYASRLTLRGRPIYVARRRRREVPSSECAVPLPWWIQDPEPRRCESCIMVDTNNLGEVYSFQEQRRRALFSGHDEVGDATATTTSSASSSS